MIEPHKYKPTEAGPCEVCSERKYHPAHHEYGEHHTYTGPGCAQCGLGPDGHQPPSKKRGEE